MCFEHLRKSVEEEARDEIWGNYGGFVFALGLRQLMYAIVLKSNYIIESLVLSMSVDGAPVCCDWCFRCVAQGIDTYLMQLSRRNVLGGFQLFFLSLLHMFVDFFCAFLTKMIRASFSGLGPVM